LVEYGVWSKGTEAGAGEEEETVEGVIKCRRSTLEQLAAQLKASAS
jgi:hypothetical protein